MSLFFSFSIAGGYLPLILRQKGIDTNTDLDTTYRKFVESCFISYAASVADTRDIAAT